MEGHEDEDPEPDFDNEDMSRFDILNHDSRFTLEIAAVAEESSERYDRLHVKCQYLDGEGDEFIERIRDENAVQLVYQIQSSLGKSCDLLLRKWLLIQGRRYLGGKYF